MLPLHMRTYKFQKLAGSDKVFVKLTGLDYISYRIIFETRCFC